MSKTDKNLFYNPELKYRVKPMMHCFWPEGDPKVMVDALKAFGYGGAVINPRFNSEDFVSDAAADEFVEVAGLLKAAGMDYWIYDSKAIPAVTRAV